MTLFLVGTKMMQSLNFAYGGIKKGDPLPYRRSRKDGLEYTFLGIWEKSYSTAVPRSPFFTEVVPNPQWRWGGVWKWFGRNAGLYGNFYVEDVFVNYNGKRYRRWWFDDRDDLNPNPTIRHVAIPEKKGLKQALVDAPKSRQGFNQLLGRFQIQSINVIECDRNGDRTITEFHSYTYHWMQCEIRRTYTRVTEDEPPPLKTETMLVLEDEFRTQGETKNLFYPTYVTLAEFCTKHNALPMLGDEPVEIVREMRAELKRELAEYVFSPERVMRMDERYGEGWMEQIDQGV